MAPPVRAGLTSARARRRALIAKRHPPMGGCRRGYPATRVRFALGRRDQGGVFRVDGLHDLLGDQQVRRAARVEAVAREGQAERRSEEHTSELQSQSNLVCRLLLEKKKQKNEKRGEDSGIA